MKTDSRLRVAASDVNRYDVLPGKCRCSLTLSVHLLISLTMAGRLATLRGSSLFECSDICTATGCQRLSA